MLPFLYFSIRRAWQGFWRNALMSLAATATMVLMLILLAGFWIIQTGLLAGLEFTEQKVEVVAYLQQNATAWQIGGRYEPNDPGDQFLKVTTSCASSAGPTGGANGCYWTATNTAWIRKYFSGNSGNSLNYIYNLICCTS